jgi:hypothetical protein
MSNKKKTEPVETTEPVAVAWHDKNRRRYRRGMVNLKHRNHPPRRGRTLLGYALIAVLAFWILRYGLHVG